MIEYIVIGVCYAVLMDGLCVYCGHRPLNMLEILTAVFLYPLALAIDIVKTLIDYFKN